MEIRRLLAPTAEGDAPLGVAVVIDVFRFTSTASMLMERGASELIVVPSPAELALLPSAAEHLIFSEISEIERADRYDNSPVIARNLLLEGRLPVLVTKNGTRAVDLASKRADQV